MQVAVRLLGLLAVLLPLVAFAADGATARLLERMAEAVRTLNYTGTFVYSHAGELRTMRIDHFVDSDGEHEHLVSLDGGHRELVRDGDEALCIIGGSRPITLDHGGARATFPLGRVGDPLALHAYYEARLGAAGRVAGRAATLLEIEPRDDLRYGYRLWIDEATTLPLKSELVGGDGVTLEQIVYTEIAIHDGPDRAEVERIRARTAWARDQVAKSAPEDAADRLDYLIEALPAGFTVNAQRRYRVDDAGAGADHIVVGDGLASVSVYVEPVGGRSALSGAARVGAVSSFAALFDDRQVVVIGDVPMKTARAIAEALRPVLAQGR